MYNPIDYFSPNISVYKYVVSVYTGKEIGADTDADVYLNVHGDRGDWGKRYLRKSNNTRKYRTGQVGTKNKIISRFYIQWASAANKKNNRMIFYISS